MPPWEAAGTVRDLLEKAVKKRTLHSEIPLAFLCSGGLDSSAIVTIAKGMKPDLVSFSMRYEGCRSESRRTLRNTLDGMSADRPYLRQVHKGRH